MFHAKRVCPVLGAYKGNFKRIFEVANGKLMDIFGMELVELPLREKVTMREKRAANASDSQPKNSNQWILRTALPEEFRISDIMTPPLAPTARVEEAYTGLYTMVIALIRLSNNSLQEAKLMRFLKRMNADQNTPLDTTERVLARMVKDGYIVKVKDNSGGDERVDYVVGPRGKLEVTERAVENIVKTVYTVGPEVDDLQRRLDRSLGLADAGEGSAVQNHVQQQEAPQEPRRRGRPRRTRDDDDDY
jgi:melanoma-associated antigen